MNVELDTSGVYYNLKINGHVRVSISQKHNEIIVYEAGEEEPAANVDLF
jgi:hypothetical protein